MLNYEFKTAALANLYKKVLNAGSWLTATMRQALDEAFSECDEELTDIQDQCDYWKVMYANACGDQDVLKESIRLLDTENRDLKKRCENLRKHNVDVITVNNKTIDQLHEDNEKLGNELQVLQKECDELKKDCEYMTNSRNAWRSRAKHAEAEAVELAKKRDKLQEENEDLKKKLTEANDILEETDSKEEWTMTLTMDNADYKRLMNLLSSKAFGAPPEYMRDSLREFCDDHCFCQGCPLRFSDCNFDDMSDEEIEKLYKIAISSK